MRIPLAQFLHGSLERGGLVLPPTKTPVKTLHQVRGCTVVDVPKAEQQRPRTGKQETSYQSQQFVARRNHIESCGAPAQRNQVRFQVELIEVVKTQIGLPQPDPREHRVVLPEIAVRGYVNRPAVPPFFPQQRFAGFRTDEQFSTGQNGRNRAHLFGNERSFLIRNAENEGSGLRIFNFPLTQGKDAGAGCVGNRKRVNEVVLPVVERVERQVVEYSMGHKDEMPGIQVFAQGSDQFLVKFLQVRERNLQKRLVERPDVIRPQKELGKLQPQQPKGRLDARDDRHRYDLQALAGHQRSDQPVPHREVFR